MKEKILIFSKKHYLAIIFSLLVGLFSFAPHFLASQALGDAYQGYPFIYLDDEDHYLARMQEIIDGHRQVGSPVFFEYKDSPSINLPIGEFIYALPTLLFGVSLIKIILAAKFLFPLLLFLLVYFLVYKITFSKSKFWQKANSIAAGLFISLGYDLIDYRNSWALLSGKLDETHLLIWTRTVNPVLGALLLFSFLILLWSIINRQERFKHWLAGIILGAMIFYFFSWFLAFCVVGLFFLWSIYKKDKKLIKKFALILGLSLVLQFPYWYQIFSSLIDGGEALGRGGLSLTHSPVINIFLLACSLFFIIIFLAENKKKKNIFQLEKWQWFCSIILIASWIAFNQQLITGRSIWHFHFVQYTIPLSIIVIFICGFNYFSNKKYFLIWQMFIFSTAFFSLFFGFHSAWSYQFTLDDFRTRQNYMEIFSWLNEEAPKDCVVLVKEDREKMSRLIPAFTHCNTYISTYTFSGVPMDRVLHNYLVSLRLQDIKPENIEEYLWSNPEEVNNYFFTNYQESLDKGINKNTEEKIADIANIYKTFYNAPLATELENYRIDYLLSEGELDDNLFSSLPLEVVHEYKGFYLYKYNQINR